MMKSRNEQDHQFQMDKFLHGLSDHITQTAAEWKTQGPEVAASLIAAVLDFSKDDSPIWLMYRDYMAMVKKKRPSTEPIDQEQLDVEDANI